MWAAWTTRLGRPSEEFWALTFREIDACFKAHMDELELQAAMIASAVYGKPSLKSTDQTSQQFERKGRDFDAMARMLADRAKQKRSKNK